MTKKQKETMKRSEVRSPRVKLPVIPAATPAAKGFTLIELLIVTAIILIIAALMVPKVLAALNSANESKAATQTRSLATATQNYSNREGGYPSAVASFGATGTYDPCTNSQLVDATLIAAVSGNSPVGGYTYVYAPLGTAVTNAAGCSVNPSFLWTATPVRQDKSQRSFCISDATGAIHFNDNGTLIPDAATCASDPLIGQ